MIRTGPTITIHLIARFIVPTTSRSSPTAVNRNGVTAIRSIGDRQRVVIVQIRCAFHVIGPKRVLKSCFQIRKRRNKVLRGIATCGFKLCLNIVMRLPVIVHVLVFRFREDSAFQMSQVSYVAKIRCNFKSQCTQRRRIDPLAAGDVNDSISRAIIVITHFEHTSQAETTFYSKYVLVRCARFIVIHGTICTAPTHTLLQEVDG